MRTYEQLAVAYRGFLVLIIVALLDGCAGARVPVSSEEVRAQVTGVWSGTFTNRSANQQVSGLLPVRYSLTAEDGRISGRGETPWVDYDPKPTVTGSYSGSQVSLATSSGFEYQLIMERVDQGIYYLRGRVVGPKRGRIELWKISP